MLMMQPRDAKDRVETVEDGPHRARQVVEVPHPSEVAVDGAPHVHGDPIGVTVQSRALVPVGDVRKAVRCLERELFEDLHDRSTVLLVIGEKAA